MFESLENVHRLLFEQEMRPAQGDRFQPTGFADLGAAVYELPNGKRKLLVESAQSMANRFEHAIAGHDGELLPEFRGLSYMRTLISGAADTYVTSLTEPHRINSPWFIGDRKFADEFSERAKCSKTSPLDWRKIGAAIFYYDVNSLLHGCFLANLDGRIKLQRALAAFIEADNPREALSGGVKFNPIDPTGKLRAEHFNSKDVYGNVPFHRMEYTAERITAYFSLDLSLLRGFAFEQCAFDLLVALALYKVRHFLENGGRLRTACDLVPVGIPVMRTSEHFELPFANELLDLIEKKTAECAKAGLFADPPVTELKAKAIDKGDKQKNEEADEAHENDEDAL